MNLLNWFGGGSSQRKEPSFGRDAVYLPDPMGRLGQGTWKRADDLPDPFGRLALPEPEPVSRFAISWDRDDVSVAKPVGPRGANRPGDVGRIEQMLGTTGHLNLDATDGPTGFFGRRLEGAIKNYQKDRGLKVDGVIKPGGETIRSLSDLFGQPPEIAGGNRQNEWDRFWDSRMAPKVGAEPEDGAPRQRNMFLTPQDRAKDPRKSMMPMVHRPGYVWEDGYWRRETPDENLRRNIELFTEKASGNQPPDSHDDFTAYPQTGGKAPEGPDAGSGNRKPKPGETQVAAAPLAAGLPAAAKAAPWLLGALGAGIAGKEFLERYPNLRLPGVGGSDGTNADESDGSVENFRPPKLDGRVFPGTRPPVLEPFPGKPGAYPGPETGQAKPEIETFPAADEPQLGPLKGRKPEPREPFIETLPDQSGEFDGFNVTEYKKLPKPNDLSAGDKPDKHVQSDLDRMPPGRFKDMMEQRFLREGVQTFAGKIGTQIETDRPASQGPHDLEAYVKALGGNLDDIDKRSEKNGERHTYHDPESGNTVQWRTYSNDGRPTLEVQIKQASKTIFDYKTRYNP